MKTPSSVHAFPNRSHLRASLPQFHGSPDRLNRSVTSNSRSGSRNRLCVSTCRRFFPINWIRCSDVEDSNSHSRDSSGVPREFASSTITAPVLSPQKQSSGWQEPHIRTRNWSVESGWCISTRVRWSVFEWTFFHWPIMSVILSVSGGLEQAIAARVRKADPYPKTQEQTVRLWFI